MGTPRGRREGAGSLLSWLGVPMRQGHLPAPGAQEGRDGQVQPVHLPPVLGRSCTWMTCQECFWFLTGSAWRPAHPLGDLHTCAPGRAGRLISDPSTKTCTVLSGLGWGVKVSTLPSPSPPPSPLPVSELPRLQRAPCWPASWACWNSRSPRCGVSPPQAQMEGSLPETLD